MWLSEVELAGARVLGGGGRRLGICEGVALRARAGVADAVRVDEYRRAGLGVTVAEVAEVRGLVRLPASSDRPEAASAGAEASDMGGEGGV